jgi:hypothetical protein
VDGRRDGPSEASVFGSMLPLELATESTCIRRKGALEVCAPGRMVPAIADRVLAQSDNVAEHVCGNATGSCRVSASATVTRMFETALPAPHRSWRGIRDTDVDILGPADLSQPCCDTGPGPYSGPPDGLPAHLRHTPDPPRATTVQLRASTRISPCIGAPDHLYGLPVSLTTS